MMKQVNLKQLMKGVAAGALLAMVGASGSALAVTPNCGDVIGPGGVVEFDGDLDCYGHDPAITFKGPINVKMNGYTLRCTGDEPEIFGDDSAPEIGILLKKTRVLLHDGTVEYCGNDNGAGIVAAGKGKHRIERMHVSGSYADGIQFRKDGNIAQGNESEHNYGHGFNIKNSDKNELRANTARWNYQRGVSVKGHNNKLLANIASYNDKRGINVNGNQNTVSQNTADKNDNDGIRVQQGTGNRINLNLTLENGKEGIDVRPAAMNTVIKSNNSMTNDGDDMQEDSPGCANGSNWSLNVFGSSNDPCIPLSL